jgi:hypothetical protein
MCDRGRPREERLSLLGAVVGVRRLWRLLLGVGGGYGSWEETLAL